MSTSNIWKILIMISSYYDHFVKSYANKNSTRRIYVVAIFFLIYLLIGLSVYQDYGVSWDEPASRNNGLVTLKHLGEKFMPDVVSRDAELKRLPKLENYIDKDYGIAFELPVSFVEKYFSLKDSRDIYFLRHLATFFVFYCGVFAIYLLAERRFQDWRIGILGALIMILSPRMFAESFYNDKDIVFMALFAIALNTTVCFLKKPTPRIACLHAVTTAILIDVRLMGVVIPVVTLVMIVLRLLRGEVAKQKTLIAVLSYLILCVVLVVALWPYLWSEPMDRFLQAFMSMANFRWDNKMLYLGEWVRSTELPWHYIPVWVVITSPIPYVFLFITGMTAVLRRLSFRRLVLWSDDGEWQDLLFWGLFISPVLAVIALNSVLYDGWRQMYFIYPAFVLVALKGLVTLSRWRPPRYSSVWIGGVGVSVMISFISIGVWIQQAHPHQNVYFNVLAGSDVKHKFEVDYWGVSSRQIFQYIADNDKRPAIKIWAGSWIPLDRGKLLLEHSDRQRIHIVSRESKADYVITQYRHNLKDYGAGEGGYERYYQIDVDGEEVITVFRR